jgi:hypothetical protein
MNLFENLLIQNSDQVIVSNDNINENSYDATILNETITREKIAKAVEHAKLRKTCGIDEIPVTKWILFIVRSRFEDWVDYAGSSLIWHFS